MQVGQYVVRETVSLSDLKNLDPEVTLKYVVTQAEENLCRTPLLQQRNVEISELECNTSNSKEGSDDGEWETEEEEEVEYDDELISRQSHVNFYKASISFLTLILS